MVVNNEIEKKLWKRVEIYLSVLQIIPFVKMVAVCNNLAFGKVDEESDIDLFVVVEEGRLFFVRTLVTALLHSLGVRRYGKKVAGRFCLSFFVDESTTDLSRIAFDDDVYLAFWMKSMKPVIDNGFTDAFLSENEWARSYFESPADFKISKRRLLPVGQVNALFNSMFAFAFGGSIGDFFEKKLSVWQKKRALRKAALSSRESNLVVTDHMLKFHNIDRRKSYRDKWRAKFGDKKLTEKRFLLL